MQLLINGYFWAQPTVGSGQYLHGLLAHLPQIAAGQRIIVARPAFQGAAAALPAGVEELRLSTPFDGRPKLGKIAFEQLALPAAAARLARQAPTVLFVPYFGGPLFSRVPVVTTVGDLIPLVLPAYRGGPAVRAYSMLVSAAARRSRQILTFSEFSRREVIQRLQIAAERVHAIALAAGDAYRPAASTEQVAQQLAQRYGLHGPYVYYVGGLDARKNLLTLLTAWAAMPQHLQHIPLVIAGRALGRSSTLFPDLDAAIAQLGLAQRVRRIDVPAADGPLLYQGAELFVFPSRYEGFGLPPLEAMSCGVPVICSNASSLPEVVGNAAVSVDADDRTAWTAALTALLEDPARRADLRRRGLQHAEQFRYRQTTRASWDILSAVD